MGVVYCEGVNVNEAILDNDFADIYENFCDVSEFADTNWSQEHGCSSDSSNDLDCKDFDEKNIPVGTDDPHNLDADGDGLGCEG